MNDQRKTPEELLAQVQEEESRQGKGKLKIFLGAAAGVGKTYRMLEAGKELLSEGADVVAGCIVTHNRKEVGELLSGFEIIPLQIVSYQNSQLEEFDLDATLTRAPGMVLVDELAHTNAPGLRHEKRWQDVEELLDAGINVATTMNIQHLESANDIVAQITGIQVRETVPDSVFEEADEIEVIDLPPDELIQRLKEGKVYIPDKVHIALENFFRKGNLMALRELALRSAAQRVDKQIQKYRKGEYIEKIWPAGDRLLACVGPHRTASRTIRATKRMAAAMDADWLAVFVETPVYATSTLKVRESVARALRLAETLGAQTAVLSGTKVVDEVLNYARSKNVSKIVIGKPVKPRWRELLFGSITDELIRGSGDIDVYVITSKVSSGEPASQKSTAPAAHSNFSAYVKAVGLIALTTALNGWLFRYLHLVNLVMIYQLAVVIIALRYGGGAAIAASILSVVACDFFFIPPYLTFAVSDTQYFLTLIVMLVVAIALSTLTHTVKFQAEAARKRERRTAALYAMTREQSMAVNKETVLKIASQHIREIFDSEVALFLAETGDMLKLVEGTYRVDAHELAVAQWAYINGQMAGADTATLPGTKAIYLPLKVLDGTLGAIGVLSSEPKRFLHPEDLHLLDMFVTQTAFAVERALASEKAHGAAI